MRGRFDSRRQRYRPFARQKEDSPTPKYFRRKPLLIESVEAFAKRSVTIETLLTDDNLSRCHQQEQSPLFKLPAELRTLIFEHTALPFNDPKNQYADEEYYYRPEHIARHIISTSFLLTCRRAWLEASHLPMTQADHCFWLPENDRRPKHLNRLRVNEGVRLDRKYR